MTDGRYAPALGVKTPITLVKEEKERLHNAKMEG